MNNIDMRCSSLFLFVFASISIGDLKAQDNPSPRSTAHLFYFGPTKSLLLFDGYSAGPEDSSKKAGIWQWKNGWKKIDSTGQPLRTLSAGAYEPDKNQVFIFGGIGIGGYDDSLKESYVYDGKKWWLVKDNSIGTRDHHEMAYDELNKTVIVYGGQNAKREFDTLTWMHKKDRWTSLKIPAPGPRVHHAMAYDIERKKLVLYGGYTGQSDMDETWEFDGIRWIKVLSTITPGPRTHHAMVYDSKLKRVLLYGGTADMKARNDLWSWDGKNWNKISESGPARVLPALAFNPDNNKVYVFGGSGREHFVYLYSDLWEWDGKNWKQLANGKTYKFDMEKNRFVEVQD